MSRSLGPVEAPPTGSIRNDKTGWSYSLRRESEGTVLESTAPDGGLRRQRIVGRVGAGIFDRSWAAVELDAEGKATDRLFFAPVETITKHGLELSPFEYSEVPSGPDMPMGQGCLVCHTDTRASDLPEAKVSSAAGLRVAERTVHPDNALGADAFEHLEPLGCAACHGDASRHMSLMKGERKAGPGEDDLGLARLSALSAGRQRDVCARCHLQGDARFDLTGVRPSLSRPLAAQMPVLIAQVPRERVSEDFRFVAQLERLAHSACFTASPSMTCTTCHSPHRSVAEQGLKSFEKACVSCHGDTEAHNAVHGSTMTGCSRPAGLEVAAVTGSPSLGPAGCVDCHMRRSQPYDLPGIRSIDHYIRRRPSKPREVPFRAVQNDRAALVPYDDGRLSKVLATAGGRRWSQGLAAMAYTQVGRFDEANAAFESFPAPGSRAARQGSAPSPLEPLEIQPAFHEQRATAFLAAGRPDQALLSFGDALALDPSSPGALLGRAQMAVGMGDARTALLDTQKLIELWPGSEAPWEVRLRLAERLGRSELAREALEALTARWPSNAEAWVKLGMLRQRAGQKALADEAFAKARRLSPLALERQAPVRPSR